MKAGRVWAAVGRGAGVKGGRAGCCIEIPGVSRAAMRWSPGTERPPGDERAWWAVWA